MDKKEVLENNKKQVKLRIQKAFMMKSAEGKESKQILEELSNDFYKFITKQPDFTRENVSSALTGILIEKYRKEIELALEELYFEYIEKSDNFNDKYDNYTKDILESSNDRNKLLNTIFSNNEMIYRMRRSSC